MIVEIGRIEAILPRKEQSRAESYNQGDRVRAVIRGVSKSAKGPQVGAVAHRRGAAHQAVRAGSAGDLRRHGDDPRRRPRGRRPGQGGGLLARARHRSGGRLRRHEGHARAGDHSRTARREDRHRRVVGRPGRIRDERAQPGQGAARLDHLRGRPGDGSGRRGQPAVAGHRQEGPERARWPPSSPAGRSTSRARKRNGARSRPSSARSKAGSGDEPGSEAEAAVDSAEPSRRTSRTAADGAAAPDPAATEAGEDTK